MQLLIFSVVGISAGVVLAGLRVPKVRGLPLICATVLAGVAVAGLLQLEAASLGEGLALLVGAVLASALYSGWLWQRGGLDPSVTYWGWVQRDLTNPSYGRRLYADSKAALRR